jgi:predicted component of type VI protein secretion system
MTLTLRIRNVDRLDNGMPVEFVLHRRGAMIGRSPTCDWSLPDPRNYISSKHCEVTFADGYYTLIDRSMNGTLMDGGVRMTAPHRIQNGDVFIIGQYEIVAALTGEAIATIQRDTEAAAASAARSEWGGWDRHAGPAATPTPSLQSGWEPAADAWASPSSGDWGPAPEPAPPPGSGGRWDAPASTGWGTSPPPPSPSVPQGWSPDANLAAPSPSNSPSTWEAAPPPSPAASDWSSPAPTTPSPSTPDDIWGRIAEGNVVDWARGGFGAAPPAPVRDPLNLSQSDPRESLGAPPASVRSPDEKTGWGSRPSAPVPPPTPGPTRPDAAPGTSLAPLLNALGLVPNQVSEDGNSVLQRAGDLLRRLVSGLVVMTEARARAKSQMGAEVTSFSFDGNNPIKFARTPEEALTALLNAPVRGFMDGNRAVEDAFFDLQSHQMATLKAMQGALRATLDRFSPTAIEKRAETRGLFQRIMPGARDAALWQAYVREFSGVAQGSDEAFMDVFAKEFRRAYEEQSTGPRRS